MTDVEITATPEPLAVFRKRYTCPFPGCRFQRSTEKPVAGHIVRCWRNPANRTCKSCANYEKTPDYGPCFPGENCRCGAPDHSCNAGVELPDFGELEGFPVVACPLWEAVNGRG